MRINSRPARTLLAARIDLEVEHRPGDPFDCQMVLLGDVAKVFPWVFDDRGFTSGIDLIHAGKTICLNLLTKSIEPSAGSHRLGLCDV